MTLVERVAQALADNHLLISDGHYTLAARAAIEAMREPSVQMTEAGFPSWDETEAASEAELRRAARRVWSAMVDAALEEGK